MSGNKSAWDGEVGGLNDYLMDKYGNKKTYAIPPTPGVLWLPFRTTVFFLLVILCGVLNAAYGWMGTAVDVLIGK